jgi:hypothetical protein
MHSVWLEKSRIRDSQQLIVITERNVERIIVPRHSLLFLNGLQPILLHELITTRSFLQLITTLLLIYRVSINYSPHINYSPIINFNKFIIIGAILKRFAVINNTTQDIFLHFADYPLRAQWQQWRRKQCVCSGYGVNNLWTFCIFAAFHSNTTQLNFKNLSLFSLKRNHIFQNFSYKHIQQHNFEIFYKYHVIENVIKILKYILDR